ncbi:MAG: PqqD family protein [Syntrophomonadaceae bacterium]
MPLSFKERKKILKEANYLELTPYRVYREEVDENGIVTVLVPKFTNRLLAKYLLPRLKSTHFKIKLDEIGSATWMQIDGKKNVQQIADILDGIFGDKIQPVYERLTRFFTRMYMEGYISFNEIKKEGE